MGLLKFADKNAVKRYETPEGDGWIDLRTTLTKGEMNSLFNNMPDSLVKQAVVTNEGENGEVDIAGTVLIFREAPEMSKALFAAYAKAWSLEAPCTIDSYLDLDGDASAWIDGVLMEHSQRSDAQMKSAEGKQPKRSRRGSQKATELTTS